jgi:hypothetical protein
LLRYDLILTLDTPIDDMLEGSKFTWNTILKLGIMFLKIVPQKREKNHFE